MDTAVQILAIFFLLYLNFYVVISNLLSFTVLEILPSFLHDSFLSCCCHPDLGPPLKYFPFSFTGFYHKGTHTIFSFYLLTNLQGIDSGDQITC